LSVPDISLHFLIQHLKVLNQLPKRLIQNLILEPATSFAPVLRGTNFSKEITGLAAIANPQSESRSHEAKAAACARFAFG